MPEATGTDLNTASEDEYEYEYSTTETESFYIHLDLSTVNGVLKSSNATNRKSLGGPNLPKHKKKGKGKARDEDVDMNIDEQDDQDQAQEVGPDHNADEEAEVEQSGNTLGQDTTSVGVDGPSDSIQIMALHSDNPIISYRNQIYSCVWTDTIGTSMFFSKHNETPIHEPEIATEDYDLLGTTRVKLVGYKATVTPKQPGKETKTSSQTHKQRRQSQEDGNEDEGHDNTRQSDNSPIVIADDDSDSDANEDDPGRTQPGDISAYIPANYTTTGPRRTDPQTQSHIKRQAAFLEKLKDIKRSRGEHDKVRTFVDRHTLEAAGKQASSATNTNTNTSITPPARKPRTPTTPTPIATATASKTNNPTTTIPDSSAISSQTRKEIEELNARVVRGDTQALERLQEIYALIEEVRSDDEDGEDDHQQAGPSTR